MADEPKRGGAPVGKALLAAVGLVAGAFVVRGAIQRAGRAKAYLPEGLDEKLWLPIGGIEQWVTIRGRDPQNPILLVLHGGPGAGLGPFAKSMHAWESQFTVVNWDQRGAARTFGRNGKSGSGKLTVGRMVVDGVELAETLTKRFPARPIVLMGWSWGTLLGAEMIRARPDLFAAYVGVGQVIDVPRGEQLSYFGAIDRLRAKGDERRAAALEGIGPPPYPTLRALGKQRKLLATTMPKAERQAMRKLWPGLLFGADARLKDLTDYLAAARFSVASLWKQIEGWRLADGGLEFALPLVFIEGELDMVTPTPLVTEITPRLQAPAVDLVVIEGAGHALPLSHPDEFTAALIKHVRPLVAAGGRKPRRKRAPPAPTARRRSGSSRPSGRPRT